MASASIIKVIHSSTHLSLSVKPEKKICFSIKIKSFTFSETNKTHRNYREIFVFKEMRAAQIASS